MTRKKHDLSREFKELYTASAKRPKIIDVPGLNFLMFDGKGLPHETPDFTNAMGALFSGAYTLKFMLKEKGKDFKVMMPETVWKVGENPQPRDSKKWKWTAMICVPEFVKKTDLARAMKLVRERSRKKKQPAPQVEKLRLEKMKQGRCVQVLQLGPYEQAARTYERLKAFAAENGLRISGHCKEIYCNDPHRVKPEKIKTMVRYPVSKCRPAPGT